MKRRSFLKGLSAISAGMLIPTSYAKQQADVIILGAGLSGLSAAFNLKQAGLNVVVLEADYRVGGRVKTLDNVITKPESGGMQIGKGYGYMRTLAQQLNVPLAPMPALIRGSAFIIDQQLISAQQWPSHISNRLNTAEKKLLPSQLFPYYMRKMPRLGTVGDWNAPKNAQLDRSMTSLLKEAGASDQAIALMDANINANSLDELSAADAIHVMTQMMAGGRATDKTVGGNSRFVEAMANQLPSQITLGKRVTKLVNTNGGVTVTCKDGSTFSAKHCICTIPFSVLRNIDIQAPLSETQRAAINELKYTAITQAHFEVTDESWLDDGLPANIWSNSNIGRVFASKGSNQKIQHLVSWTNGNAAKTLDKLSADDALSHVHQSLIKYRPSLKGKIKPVHLNSWGNNPFSLGAYSSFGPGQVQKFAGKMAESAGNLHFAGEHTNHENSGMESALISGLIAATKVMDNS